MKIILLALFMSFMSIQPSRAGTEMGHGSDNFGGSYGAAWFLGEDKTVTFCVDLDPAFGRSINEIRTDIQAGWQKWLTYVAKKGIYLTSTDSSWRFPKSLQEKSCDGSEDLRFHFGSEDAEIKREKLNYQLPSAISYRKSYDEKLGWGKGWIWFSRPGTVDPRTGFPNWHDDIIFKSILLHEFGHVFGNFHMTGTIMDQALSDELSHQRMKPEWMGKIDQIKELLPRGLSSLTSDGYLGGTGFFNPYRAFEWLMGRKAMGKVDASLKSLPTLGAFELRVKDSLSGKVFPVKLSLGNNNPSYSSDVPVFKRYRAGGEFAIYGTGGIQFGSLTHPTLGEIPVIFESSMSSAFDAIGPFGVKAIMDGFPQHLFSGFPEL